jgi:hypothetical protein
MEMNSRFNAKVLCNEGKDTKKKENVGKRLKCIHYGPLIWCRLT